MAKSGKSRKVSFLAALKALVGGDKTHIGRVHTYIAKREARLAGRKARKVAKMVAELTTEQLAALGLTKVEASPAK